MNDKPIETTLELIDLYGDSLLDDPERLGQLLEDKCGEYKREIFILCFALREVFRNGNVITAEKFLEDRERAVERFCESLGFSKADASWAVEGIARVLEKVKTVHGKDAGPTQAYRGVLQDIGEKMATRPRTAPLRKKALRNGLLLLGIIALFLGLFWRIVGTVYPLSDEHRILFLAHLSGPDAASGHVRLKAAQMAADQINGMGGIKGRPLRIHGQDIPAEPGEAAKLVDRILRERKITAMISTCSDAVTIAVARVADERELPLVTSESSLMAVTMASEGRPWLYTFRTNYDNVYKGKLLAYFLAQGLARKTCTLLFEGGNPDSEEIRAAFLEANLMFGGNLRYEASYSRREGLMQATAAEIILVDADALVIANPMPDISGVIQMLRRSGYEGTILGVAYDGSLQNMAGQYLNNSWWIIPTSPDDPQLQSFQTGYRDKYNEPISRNDFTGAVLAYDSVQWMADAIFQARGFQGEALRHAFLSTRNLSLTHATFTMDPRSHGPWNKAAALIYCSQEKGVFQKRFRPR